MPSNATTSILNSRWKQAPSMASNTTATAMATITANSANFHWKGGPPDWIYAIGPAVVVVVIVHLILFFLWWIMKNQPEQEEHNAELPQDHQPHAPMMELPRREFHAGEAATDCPVCLEEFVEGERLVELPTCLHAFHPACIETWLTWNHTSCPLCRLHIELQVDNVV